MNGLPWDIAKIAVTTIKLAGTTSGQKLAKRVRHQHYGARNAFRGRHYRIHPR